ncbi:MAG TPA: hypothetical protein VE824_04210 [Gaiellales bacterium]|nr:hypothetical protein [Gaiellales bacterium]
MTGIHPLTLAVLAAALCAGCGSGQAAGSSGATGHTSTQASTAPPASQPPAVDHDVVRWKRRWHLKVLSPVNNAIRILNANAVAAAGGDSTAAYRLTHAFDTLDNCRVPLESPPMQRTPPVLLGARRQTLHACRQFYTGVDGVIRGLNAADPDAAAAGLRQINAGARTLQRAGRLVDAAPTTVG